MLRRLLPSIFYYPNGITKEDVITFFKYALGNNIALGILINNLTSPSTELIDSGKHRLIKKRDRANFYQL